MLVKEMRAITAYLRELFPDCTTALSEPTRPASGLWVVRHERVTASPLTGAVNDVNREYTVIVHHENEETAIEQMDTFHKAVMGRAVAHNDGVAVRFTGLGYSSPVKLDGGLYGLVGMLTTQTLSPTDTAEGYPVEPLVMGVHSHFN